MRNKNLYRNICALVVILNAPNLGCATIYADAGTAATSVDQDTAANDGPNTEITPLGGVNTFTGKDNGRVWHDARNGGYLDLAMKTSPTRPNLLQVTYWGGDGDREFDVLVNGTRVTTQTLDNEKPGEFFTVSTRIPLALTQGKSQVTVRFQSLNGKTAGGVYGARIVNAPQLAPVVLNPVRDFVRTPTGITCNLQTGALQLEVFAPRVVRVYYSARRAPAPRGSLAVIAKPTPQKWSVSQSPAEITLKTKELQVRINRATSAVSFYNAAGQPILAETSGGRNVTPVKIGGWETLQCQQGFALAPEEAIFGLGQHQKGEMNYRGKSVHLQQKNTDVAIPVLVSSRGYGIFWDNPAITDVNVGAADPATLEWKSEAGKAIDYYFMYGPELDGVVQGYRNLTGAVPMFGKWAWGLWQSRERYTSQQELLDVVAKYREAKIPLDGIIQDWQYWTPNPWGSHQFDAARYPDPVQMMKDLHANNAHLLISVWPKFDVDSPNANELRKAGALYPPVIPYVFPPGKGQWYDPFNPLARTIYWRQMKDQLFKAGVDGWWLDASEAELSGKWGEFRDYQTGAGPGAEVFNAYPSMHTTAIYQGQRAATSEKRAYILTRSAYAGQQRNAATTWSGDIGASWDVYRRQIPAGINFTLTGIPYWNTDTGGFFGNNPDDPNWRELFTRWFQFSTFCPMLRIHGTDKPKEIWRFTGEAHQALTKFDNLRYHLLPYIYSTSWQVSHEGYTMMRSLVMDFRHDSNVYNIPDQYLFGPALMACPVTQAGATTRCVYLPKGTTWTDFWTGKTYVGGQNIEAAAPFDKMPLWVKAGSILPYGPSVQDASQKTDPLELRIYRGANGTFTLYEDEGDNYNYEHGIYSTIAFNWDDKSQTLKISKRQGQFPGMLANRTFKVVLVKPGAGVDVNSSSDVDKVVVYRGKAVTLRF